MATLGQQLKAAREAKGISEHDAGAATKILTRMITAMEADDFSCMAAPMYAKGFIRLYAGYLGLNPGPLVEEYMAKYAPAPKPLNEEPPQTEAAPRKSSFKPPAHMNESPAPGAPVQLLSKLWNMIPRPKPRVQKDEPQDRSIRSYLIKDIRLAAAGIAGLLVLIILIVSVTNCARRHTAEQKTAAPRQAEAARRLMDAPLPDLYLVEPGKVESSR
jgi:hypothetical protein